MEKLKQLFKKYFDYDIVGEYYDIIQVKSGHYRFEKKYNKHYYFKPYRQWLKKVKRK